MRLHIQHAVKGIRTEDVELALSTLQFRADYASEEGSLFDITEIDRLANKKKDLQDQILAMQTGKDDSVDFSSSGTGNIFLNGPTRLEMRKGECCLENGTVSPREDYDDKKYWCFSGLLAYCNSHSADDMVKDEKDPKYSIFNVPPYRMGAIIVFLVWRRIMAEQLYGHGNACHLEHAYHESLLLHKLSLKVPFSS